MIETKLPIGWRVLTMHGQPWFCVPPVHYPDMSDGAIIDRFYQTCLDAGSKNPPDFYQEYDGRFGFCRSVRRSAIPAAGVPVPVTRALSLMGETLTPKSCS